MSMSSLSSISRFSPPPPKHARPALQASGPASVVQNQRTGARGFGDVSNIGRKDLAPRLFIEMLGAVHNPKALVPQEFFLNTDCRGSLRDRISSLVNGYISAIDMQIKTIEAEVHNSGELRYHQIKPDTIGIAGGLPSELLPELTLQTKNPFKHSKIHYPGGYTAKTYYGIDTKLPNPKLSLVWDYQKNEEVLPDHPLLKTGTRNFWKRFRKLVDPTNAVPTIPRSMLTRPPLTGRQLEQLLASIRLLEKASLDAEKMSESGTLEIDKRFVRSKPHFSN